MGGIDRHVRLRAFTPTEDEHARFSRHVLAASWRQPAADLLEFWIEADSVLRHMNRVLAGTMLEVAGGRPRIEEFAALLEGRPGSDAESTALHGLYLAGVGYGGERMSEKAALPPEIGVAWQLTGR